MIHPSENYKTYLFKYYCTGKNEEEESSHILHLDALSKDDAWRRIRALRDCTYMGELCGEIELPVKVSTYIKWHKRFKLVKDILLGKRDE